MVDCIRGLVMTNRQLKQFESEKSAAWNRYFEASRALKPWQFQERAALDAAYQQEHAAIVAKWESMEKEASK